MQEIKRQFVQTSLILDLIDDFQLSLMLLGRAPRPRGKTIIWAMGEINGRSFTPFPDPIELLTVQNSGGYHLFFGKVKLKDGRLRNRYLQNKKHRLNIINPNYQIVEVDVRLPSPTSPIQVKLLPSYAYSFPLASNNSMTLVRGVIHDKNGKGVSKAKVKAGSLHYQTDKSGQWVLIMPSSEQAGQKSIQVTFPDQTKKSIKVDINHGGSSTAPIVIWNHS